MRDLEQQQQFQQQQQQQQQQQDEDERRERERKRLEEERLQAIKNKEKRDQSAVASSEVKQTLKASHLVALSASYLLIFCCCLPFDYFHLGVYFEQKSRRSYCRQFCRWSIGVIGIIIVSSSSSRSIIFVF